MLNPISSLNHEGISFLYNGERNKEESEIITLRPPRCRPSNMHIATRSSFCSIAQSSE